MVTAVYGLAFMAQYAVLPYYDNRYRAVLFPGDHWRRRSRRAIWPRPASPLAYVVGSTWLGGNIGHYSPEHPRTLIDGNPRRAPWIDLNDLAANGAVVVWAEDPTTLPERYAMLAGSVAPQPPLGLPMRRGNGEVAIGWAILRPVRHAGMGRMRISPAVRGASP